MTFLELCNRVVQESGISGAGLISVEVTAATPPILRKVVEWVRQADIDIQTLQDDWGFRWAIGTLPLLQGQGVYTAMDLGLMDLHKFRGPLIRSNGGRVHYMPWRQFSMAGYQRETALGDPQLITVRPDGLIMVYPTPAHNVDLDAEYTRKAVRMLDSEDQPLIPEQWHDVILHKALMYYANHEEDNDLFEKSRFWYEQRLTEMGADQLPVMGVG